MDKYEAWGLVRAPRDTMEYVSTQNAPFPTVRITKQDLDSAAELSRLIDRTFGDSMFGPLYPFFEDEKRFPKPKKVIYNPPATVVLWPDGSKTVAKCEDGEEYDPEKGLMVALLKKLYGNRAFHDLMDEFLPKEEEK